MNKYVISYELRGHTFDYMDFYGEIKKCSEKYWHILEPVWVVYSELTAKELTEKLMSHMYTSIAENGIYSGDKLVIMELADGENFDGFAGRKFWDFLRGGDDGQ